MSVDNTQDITVLSLCAGYGGLEIGLARALQRLLRVVAVEVEAYALANLVAKAEEGKLGIEALWPDLRTFPAERFRECFDIITAGYPCQGESCAGKRLGKADPRWLWPYIERIIKAVRPVWFFGENVPGHLTLGFPTVYRSLRNLGYTVEAGLFTAEEVGAPHKRERVFVLAHHSNSRCEDVQIQQERKPSFGNGCRSLADTKRTEQGQGTIEETSAAIGGDRFTIEGMGNTKHAGPQGPGPGISAGVGEFAWPAPPGQPQYKWEEPRVVGNARGNKRNRAANEERQNISEVRNPGKKLDDSQLRRHKHPKGQIHTRWDRIEYTDKGQSQSRLGGAVDGASFRVDRLRLLGNGVVPQQAEKAFRELMRLFE